MLDSSLGVTDAIGYGTDPILSLLLSSFSLLPWILGLVFLSFVLYFFTGSNRRGDHVIPNLMRVGVKMFTNLAMFVGGITLFYGLYQMINFIATEVLPEASSKFAGGNTADDKTFVTGLVLVLFGLTLWGAGKWSERKIFTAEENSPTTVRKFFMGLGLLLYGAIWFISTLSVIMSVIDYAYDDASTVSASAVAFMFASLILLAKYKYYAWKIIARERAGK